MNRLRRKPSWLLSQAAIAGDRLVNEALADEGVLKSRFRVLLAMADDGPLSQAELGRRVHVDRSDMAAVVAELEDLGYVTRERDATDRRRNVVALTAAGSDALERMDAAVETAQARLLEPLTPDERTQLVSLLTRLVL
jgi:MarR family transcriptional regulator, lower aerobic nicotinate degradation pathway regulator